MKPKKRWVQIRTIDQPGVHASIRAMRQVADAYADRVMIGEAYLPIDQLMAYYGADLTGFHLPFNFHLISTDWKPQAVASLIETYEAALPVGGWPNWVLGNHDRTRVASRVGIAQARVAAMLLLTLRGTPTVYQGEEIGMVDTPIPPHLVQDPLERNVPGFNLGRDPVRTPMPWSLEPHGGFTDGQPWLPLNADADVLNVSPRPTIRVRCCRYIGRSFVSAATTMCCQSATFGCWSRPSTSSSTSAGSEADELWLRST